MGFSTTIRKFFSFGLPEELREQIKSVDDAIRLAETEIKANIPCPPEDYYQIDPAYKYHLDRQSPNDLTKHWLTFNLVNETKKYLKVGESPKDPTKLELDISGLEIALFLQGNQDSLNRYLEAFISKQGFIIERKRLEEAREEFKRRSAILTPLTMAGVILSLSGGAGLIKGIWSQAMDGAKRALKLYANVKMMEGMHENEKASLLAYAELTGTTVEKMQQFSTWITSLIPKPPVPETPDQGFQTISTESISVPTTIPGLTQTIFTINRQNIGRFSSFVETRYITTNDDFKQTVLAAFNHAESGDRIQIKDEEFLNLAGLYVRVDTKIIPIPEKIWNAVIALPKNEVVAVLQDLDIISKPILLPVIVAGGLILGGTVYLISR